MKSSANDHAPFDGLIVMRLVWAMLALVLALPAACAQPPARWDDLPKLAADWPPAWAALVREAAPNQPGFERAVLDRVARLLLAEKPTLKTYQFADIVLSATLRRHESLNQAPPLAKDSSAALRADLVAGLRKLRVDWLAQLRAAGADADALTLAEKWLPIAPPGSPVRAAILDLWIHEAKGALAKNEFVSARGWLDRIDAAFLNSPHADPVRQALQERARSLLKESANLPDAPAIRALHEAIALWPRLPEARDALEQRKQTYRTLRVTVRALPEQLSPARAWSEIEKQSLELLFDRLYAAEYSKALGKRYVPRLAAAFPHDGSILLRRDAYWSSGERVTAADLRHTALLTNQLDGSGRSGLWREFFEVPRFEGNPFHATLNARQGLFDPLAPLTFFVLPQSFDGKQLQRADDAGFAATPVGSGPFRYVGRKLVAGKMASVFQANAFDLRHDPGPMREIHFSTWGDPRKDLAKPFPHLAFDVPTDQIAAFKELGYTDMFTNGPTGVHFLAVNQRRPSLASAAVRRVIAQAIDRQALLEKHFRGATLKGRYHTTANGLFPRSSWASCPAPRVPEELYQPEQARSLARKLAPGPEGFAWTLKCADDDPRVLAACEAVAASVRGVFQEAKIKVDLRALALPPYDLQKALIERDYDLLYLSETDLDDPVRLALLFDPSADAVKAGGSNYLGEDSDAKLQQLLRACLQHRQFTALQDNMHAVHAHLYETMPAIPLWQLDLHVMAHASLNVPPLQTRSVFANIHEWRIKSP